MKLRLAIALALLLSGCVPVLKPNVWDAPIGHPTIHYGEAL